MFYPQTMSNALTDEALQGLLPRERPYKLAVGKGLVLLVMPNGSKYWRFNYRHGGKYKTLALGVYPRVSIEAAFSARDKVRRQIKEGKLPALDSREKKHLSVENTPPRFSISNEGSLSIRIGQRFINLPAQDVAELRRFLNATSLVKEVN